MLRFFTNRINQILDVPVQSTAGRVIGATYVAGCGVVIAGLAHYADKHDKQCIKKLEAENPGFTAIIKTTGGGSFSAGTRTIYLVQKDPEGKTSPSTFKPLTR